MLLTDLVRAMAGSRADAELHERGTFDLKGIPEPVQIWEARWEPAEEQPLPAPTRLIVSDAWAFSGRVREMEQLEQLWGAARHGARRAVLISGEPGIGKTRLAAEAARRAHSEGALVLYGQCDDEFASPFQPFAEALDWYLEHVLDGLTGRDPSALARLSSRVPTAVVVGEAEGGQDADQRRLFDAVLSWIVDVTAQRPVVFVIDDLHWATKPTLLMLRHLLRNVSEAPLLVVATYRDTDLDRRHPLATMLGDFRRIPGIERLSLGGLDDAEILDFLARVAEQEPDDRLRELAAALSAETEGNPFFVGEVLRHLVESGAIHWVDGRWSSHLTVSDLGIPEGVREVVGQRLDRLSESANELLTIAALIGREFTVALLEDVSSRPGDDVVGTLDHAASARLLDEVGADRFRFAHAIVRATLLDEISASRRLRLHRRIAEALERLRPDDDAVLAHHWIEAAAAGDAARAVHHAVQAAQRAVAVGAYDDAIDLYERASELVADGEHEPERRELLLGLAEARLVSGRADSLKTYLDAVRATRAADDVPRLVRAMADLANAFPFSLDEELLKVLLEALDRVGDEPTPQRARLLIAAAGQIRFSFDARRDYAEEALAIARRLDDPDLFVHVGSFYFQVLTVPENLADRIAIAEEMEALMPRLSSVFSRWLALPVQPFWEAGRLDEVARHDAASEKLSEEAPFIAGRITVHGHRTKRALFEGRLAEAERSSDQMLALAGGLYEWQLIHAAQFATLRCEQGRADEVVPMLDGIVDVVDQTSVEPAVRAFHARILFEAGDVHRATQLFDEEAAHHFAAANRDTYWYAYHAHWAELAADLDHREAAERLLDALLPYTDRIANFTPVAFGAVARLVGRLETVVSRYEDAERHLAEAAATHERLGAALHLARTWADQAELMLRRDGNAASTEARALLGRATEIARAHDAGGIEHYVERVAERTNLV